jgi:hypothetical protein
LGFHFLGEALWEWLTLCPKTGPFPQTSHTFGIVVSLFSDGVRIYTIKDGPGQTFAADLPGDTSLL